MFSYVNLQPRRKCPFVVCVIAFYMEVSLGILLANGWRPVAGRAKPLSIRLRMRW